MPSSKQLLWALFSNTRIIKRNKIHEKMLTVGMTITKEATDKYQKLMIIGHLLLCIKCVLNEHKHCPRGFVIAKI